MDHQPSSKSETSELLPGNKFLTESFIALFQLRRTNFSNMAANRKVLNKFICSIQNPAFWVADFQLAN